MGRNGSIGVLTMSVSAVIPKKLCGNKKCDEEEEERHLFLPFWHRCKMAMTC